MKSQLVSAAIIVAVAAFVGRDTTFAATLDPAAVLADMKRVADWQLQQPSRAKTDDWTYGALYAGMMSLSHVSDDPKYHDAMMAVGQKHQWQPGQNVYHADFHCVSQMYLELYWQHRDPAMLAPTQERFDHILANPSEVNLHWHNRTAHQRWAWCDALFMAPPAWIRLHLVTGDKRYLDFMDREWRATSDFLYDTTEHLYYRDSGYFTRREANKKPVFWSRGNGWVMGGLARVLQVMPFNHPQRKFYERQFQQMAAKLVTVQQPDGTWRSGLLDAESYPLKETSGSGFFTFALAWGLNRGVLDRATYEPIVRKGWDGLLSCVTAEGRLEHVQPVGDSPKAFQSTNTAVYGVGALLLAGSEMYRLALTEPPAFAYATFVPQRKDDFAWETDRIAFRVYGPALEAAGEVSSGIDVWVKRTRQPVLERWYYSGRYHDDRGEGLDYYKVGGTRGCGGTGIWRDNQVHVAKNFVTWKIIENGPKRVEFELGYAPFAVGEVMVRETRRISLEAGSNLNRIETRFEWAGGPEELDAVVGLAMRGDAGELAVAPDNSWMLYWEPTDATHGTTGCGVLMNSPATSLRKDGQAFLKTPVKRGSSIVYHAGAGWDKSGDFPDKAAGERYLLAAAQKLKSK